MALATIRTDRVKLKQLRDKLGRFTSNLETRPLEIMQEEAPSIEEDAKRRAPYDYSNKSQPHLRDNIECFVGKEPDRKTIYTLILHAHRMNGSFNVAEEQETNEGYAHPSLRNQAKGYTNQGEQAHYILDAWEEGRSNIARRIHEEVGYDR